MLALFIVTGSYAEDKTSTLEFTAACNGSGTSDDDIEWTVTSDAEESVFGGKGIHYGTGSAAVSYLQLATSGIEGTISKIVVNASGASGTTAKLNVTVGGNSFGSEQSLTSTTAAYTFEGTASGEIIVRLSQTSAKKALYVKSIAVTYSTETQTGTEDPQNSFSVTEDNATIGVEYTMPAFTTSSDGRKSYTSSNTDVATINSNGEFTLKKAGTTTITVTTAQTASYAAGSASYELTVNKGTPELSFASETFTVYLGTNQYGPALNNPGDGATSYSISDESIATIQANGYIQPKLKGTAIVTVTTDETDAWFSATASYTLKVEEAFSIDAIGTYELVTDASTLKEYDQILISYIPSSTEGHVFGPQQPNNFKATGLIYGAISSDKSTFQVTGEEHQDFPVTAAILEGSSSGWYFHTSEGYLYAAGNNSSNFLKTTQTINDNAKALITIEDNGNAAVVFQGSYDNRYLRYNSQSLLFSCYGSSNNQKPVQLYRKIDTQTLPKVPISFDESLVEITYGDNYDKQKATVDGFSGDLVYTSSDESVVKFHGNYVIDILKPGTVTITATAPATETTSESSATYTLKIYEPADAVEGAAEALSEDFHSCSGTNVNFGGSSGFANVPADLGWETSYCQAGPEYLKLGNSSNAGVATSPAFSVVGEAPLSFKIAPWIANNATEEAEVTVSLTNATFINGESTIELNTKDLTQRAFTSFDQYKIVGNSEAVQITFSAKGGYDRYFLDDVVVGGGAQPAHEINLTFSSAGYLTWVATADIDFEHTDGVTAYKITEATPKKITMVEVNQVAKGEAVMLKGSGTVTLTRTTGVEAFTDNKMLACADGSVTGNGVDGVTNTDVYVLGTGKNGLGFYMLKGTLQAGKGYLIVSESAGSAKQNFIAFEETTGVKTVEVNGDADNAIYNLQGIRVANPQKGIYVKNGKKYVIK